MPLHASCFFLDIDGTLVDFHDRPDAVHVTSAIKDVVLKLLGATSGAVALISGRSLADIDRLFSPMKIAASGQHGIERRDCGGRYFGNGEVFFDGDRLAEKFTALSRQYPGLILENKGLSLAVHYRAVPHLEMAVKEMMGRILDELEDGFELLFGKMVVEIRPAGKNKGTAVAEFMQEYPFSGRVPVFIGDDVTDECAFDMVNERGGYSVKVGGGPSAAHWRLADTRAVLQWIAMVTSGNSGRQTEM